MYLLPKYYRLLMFHVAEAAIVHNDTGVSPTPPFGLKSVKRKK